MRLRIHYQDTGIPLDISPEAGQTLAQAIWLSGITPPPLCSGLGLCGLCRVRYISAPPDPLPTEQHRLTPDDIAAGWRLACRHIIEKDAEVFVPIATKKTVAPILNPVSDAKIVQLAVDLGTTSLQWSAFTPEGTTIAQGQEINPQMGAGSEVMSRIAYAREPSGLARLATLTQTALHRIVTTLPAPVTEICLAANTAMTAIALGRDVTALAAAPYRVPVPGNTTITLPGLPPIYIPPQPAPFIGGDVTAGMAHVLHNAPGYPFLFVDMGTNGECVLALSPSESLLASVPLGPALEGVGLSCGGMAGPDTPGAVTAFILTPQGLNAITLGQAAPTHICAVGYLSLLHVLRSAGVLNTDGILCREPTSPLGKRIAAHIRPMPDGLRLDLPGSLFCTAQDIEEFLKVKAAFAWAVDSLLTTANLRPADILICYLAGALGMYANVDDLRALGFLPNNLRVQTIGNSSLEGARRLLLYPEERAPLTQWSAAARLLNLTEQEDNTHAYLQHMHLR